MLCSMFASGRMHASTYTELVVGPIAAGVHCSSRHEHQQPVQQDRFRRARQTRADEASEPDTVCEEHKADADKLCEGDKIRKAE